ncbi:MAG: hypothetical protein KDJ65_01475 [Anaerolineae bacterium]|nr:hypothetical protein [Anaerolineae bacterium]
MNNANKQNPIEVTFGPAGEVTINHPFDYYPLVFHAGLGYNINPEEVATHHVETVVNYQKLFNACSIEKQTFQEVYIEAWIAEAVFEDQMQTKENGRG